MCNNSDGPEDEMDVHICMAVQQHLQDLTLKCMCTHVWMCNKLQDLNLTWMCTHVWLSNNSNGPELEVPCPHVRPCACAHMYGCATTAMDLKLKPLAHMCVHVDVLTCMSVQKQHWA